MVRGRENGLNHRVSDDWGWGSCCGVEVKKRGGERLEPLRVNNELTAIG